jgi:TRAP-type C4-dicarboxylate transport system substrate-binding protein
VRIKIFPGGILGDEVALAKLMADGEIDVYAGSVASTFDQMPELAALELAFLFQSNDEAAEVLRALHPQMSEVARRHGYRYGLATSVGFRNLVSVPPVPDLGALQKMRFRSQPIPVHARFWQAAGIAHLPMHQSSVLAALEKQQIDALETSITWLFASAWHLRIKHLTLTRHIYQPGLILLGPRGLAKVPIKYREVLFRDGQPAGDQIAAEVHKVEQALLASLPEIGVHVHATPSKLIGELSRASAGLRAAWQKQAPPGGRRLLEAIERALKKIRK